jgi:hypothetical protein
MMVEKDKNANKWFIKRMSCLLQTSDAKCDAEVELKSDAQV